MIDDKRKTPYRTLELSPWHVYVVGEKGVGMVVEGVTWEMCKDLDAGVRCINWVGLLLPVGVWDK
jgi:hypothetical protein